MRRVRLMRDSILKRRTRIDEVHVKGPSRELARLQCNKVTHTESQNKAWPDNLADNENGSKNMCSFCGRQFDRRAVLLSHHKVMKIQPHTIIRPLIFFVFPKVCQQKKKPNTRISLSKKVCLDSVSNNWNDREFDDSSNSNSNSLDGISMEDSGLPALKDKSKLATKNETYVLKPALEETENPIVASTMSRRKKNRSLKATILDDANQSDDDKSLNMGWTVDETVKTEKIASPINHTDDADSNSNNNIGDIEIKTKEADSVKEVKRTRATNSGSQKTHASDSKPKLTSSHCKYCFKKFSNASNLRRHITMSHFGPKNFGCALCTFRGRRKSEVVGHMRTKHEYNDQTGSVNCDNDKPLPKPPSQGSFSRRKDKHTEVLQDDQEEIYIDSDSFMIEESIDRFKLSLEGNSNTDDVVNDINEPVNETLTEESEPLSTQNSSLKRKGRPKVTEVVKKSNQSPASVDKKESKSVPARRPVRNRIMPVKKDFVYDLSTLLKKDYKDFQDDTQKEISLQSIHSEEHAAPTKSQTQTQALSQSPPPPSSIPSQLPATQQSKSNTTSSMTIDNKITKRRNILPHVTDTADDESQTQAEEIKHQTPQEKSQNQESVPGQNSNDINSIKGAADAMAEQAVKANRAVFFKPPDLPTKRPITMPQRCGSMKDWPVLKSPSAIFANYKSKFPNFKVPGLKRKKRTCLLKMHKNRLHDKHNKTETNGTNTNSRCKSNDSEQKTPEITKISSKLVDKIHLQCTQNESDTTKTVQSNNEAGQMMTSNKHHSNVPATTPRRMTLLERLAENKTKKLNESLSRMTIANADNDSDDD